MPLGGNSAGCPTRFEGDPEVGGVDGVQTTRGFAEPSAHRRRLCRRHCASPFSAYRPNALDSHDKARPQGRRCIRCVHPNICSVLT